MTDLPQPPSGAGRVQLRAGRLHIPSEVFDRGMSGCAAIALTVRDGRWLLLPLLGGAGGLQVKMRNPRGDRVIESQEFFRQQGLEDDPTPREFELKFEPEFGGFLLRAGA